MGSYPSWALVIMNSVSKAQRTCRLLALIAFLSSPSSEEVDRSSPKISSWASLLGEPVSDLDRLRIEALGGFGPSQARPQQAPLDRAALMVVMASVAALAALDYQLTLGGAAPLEVVASLAAQDPQLAPDGAALMTIHWLAGGTWCFRQNSYV